MSVVQSPPPPVMNPHWKLMRGGQGCMNTMLAPLTCIEDGNQNMTYSYLS